MSIRDILKEQSQRLWKFLGFFQTPVLRRIHALLVLLVVLQCLSSAGMHMRPEVSVYSTPLTFICNWYHILEGIATAAVVFIMMGYSFSQRGLHRFFPYLWGDTVLIKKELQAAIRGKLPAPTAGGLATAVQGLGFGAVFLTVCSGLIWFGLWSWGGSAEATRIALSVHKNVVNLLIIYFIGHGSMALLHFILWQRKTMVK
ncbi:MAG: cytochrome b/b6 domain-containing protein [Desulfovibrionaceae bacterium]